MTAPARFECASSNLRLRMLLGRTRRLLWGCSALGIGAHLALTLIAGTEAEQKVAKPLTTQFVKRQPRLTKPLELKKRPAPRRRTVQRKMVAVTARRTQGGTSTAFAPTQALGGLARPRAEVARGIAAERALGEPETLAGVVEGAKEAANRVDMSLEMVDVEALDTGEYHAMVIQDPHDKKKIRGYFHLAVAYSRSATKEENNYFPDLRALPNLVEAINRYTDIRANIADAFPLDSGELLKTPFIFVTTHSNFDLTKSEAEGLGKYLTRGGFLFADDCLPRIGSSGDLALRRMFKDALLAVGYEYGTGWVFDKLPKDHAVYHCFFDFDAPPVGNDFYAGGRGRAPSGGGGPEGVGGPYPFLEGVIIDGRLVGIMSNKDIGCAWNDWPYQSPRLSNTRQLCFGVNMVIFALTQEGSVTERVMDEVR